MKALVQYAKENGAAELREVEKPSVSSDDVLIRVKAAGICGADIEFYRAKLTSVLGTPVILGHEFCGIIEEVGSNVKDWKPGDRVVSENTGYICGKCFACLTGQYLKEKVLAIQWMEDLPSSLRSRERFCRECQLVCINFQTIFLSKREQS